MRHTHGAHVSFLGDVSRIVFVAKLYWRKLGTPVVIVRTLPCLDIGIWEGRNMAVAEPTDSGWGKGGLVDGGFRAARLSVRMMRG